MKGTLAFVFNGTLWLHYRDSVLEKTDLFSKTMTGMKCNTLSDLK